MADQYRQRDYPVRVIRARRKTFSVKITDDLIVEMRVPFRTDESSIDRMLDRFDSWIRKHLEKRRAEQAAAEKTGKLSEQDVKALYQKAADVLAEKTAAFALKMGVSYGRITIRCQKSRWGSCSAKGNLNYNCLLMLAPEEVQDYVVVHELAHRREMNHSKAFWQIVEAVIPDWRKQRAWLKNNGNQLLGRIEISG